MDKTKNSPLPPAIKRTVDGARKFQDEVRRIEAEEAAYKTGEPRFVKGTIDPDAKK